MTLIDKAEALRIVMEECYKDREMKLATRIEERIAALAPQPAPEPRDVRESALREAAAVVRARCMGDNIREDMEVLRCEAAILALITKDAAR